jgi:hypothetical protein
MKDAGLIEEFFLEDSVEINAVRFQHVYSFLKNKIHKNPFYLLKDRTTSMPIRY